MQVPDSTTALIIFVILIVTFLVLIVEIEDAYPIKMDLLPWTMKDKPVVCVNNITEYKWAVFKAVQLFNYWTFTPQWHISIAKDCNIYISEVDGLDSGGVGQALCISNICEITLQSGNRTQVDRVRTMVHELGHVLSLGHFPAAETAQEALWLGACNTSFMWMRGECGWPEFPEDMMRALVCRHTQDGFGGNINMHCGYQVFTEERNYIEYRIQYGTGYDWKNP